MSEMKVKQLLVSCLSIALFFINNMIFATTYYAAPTGNDGNVGISASPFKTITHGVSVLIAGDTLIVQNGDYGEENVVISQSGNASNPIVIKAENIGQVILNGPRLPNEWDSESGNGFFLHNETQRVEYIQISGFYIKNYETGIYGEGNDGIPHSNIQIKNCTFENNTGDGVVFWKANDILVEDCTFISGVPMGISSPIIDDNVIQDYGIGLYYVNNSILQSNYFFGTQAQAISFKYGCHKSFVKYNIFEGVVSACVFLGQRSYPVQEYCSDIVVEKNIFRAAEGYELETAIRIDVVENTEIFLNYLEGFASHSETSGILIEVSPKGVLNIHDNILAFGTISNFASGSILDNSITTAPTFNIHHNTFYSLSTDISDGFDDQDLTFTDNLSYQCIYYDETGVKNFTGNPSFIIGEPVQQEVVSTPIIHDFDAYYLQLTNPFRIATGSSAENYGYRFAAVLGMPMVSESKTNIYPNPTHDVFFIDASEKIQSIVIYNQMGQKTTEYTDVNNKVSISNISDGIYFVLLITKNNKFITKKLIKL